MKYCAYTVCVTLILETMKYVINIIWIYFVVLLNYIQWLSHLN